MWMLTQHPLYRWDADMFPGKHHLIKQLRRQEKIERLKSIGCGLVYLVALLWYIIWLFLG